jgi:cytosine/adenosine deaminase-related metal-dependent hydrolase
VTRAVVVRGVRDPAGAVRDLACVDGRIAASAPADAEVRDGTGLLALPRLADIHVHLDKTLLGEPWQPHRTVASLEERARLERELLDSGRVAPVATRARRLLERALANGTTLVQSHVDIGADDGSIERAEALLDLAREYAGRVDLAVVAFPQQGLVRSRRCQELVNAALAAGCEAVGGLDPVAFDGDRDGHLDLVFGLAAKHACRVDVHLHEPGETGTATMRAIAERARALGLRGRCAISHGYALAQVGDAERARTAEALAEAGVSVITSVPGDGRLPPLRTLRAAGVNVVVASDNVRDSWSPFGSADQVQRAALAAYCSNWRADDDLAEALKLVTENPAVCVGRPAALLRPGDPADFTLLPAESVGDALTALPRERVVVAGGRVVADNGRIAPS